MRKIKIVLGLVVILMFSFFIACSSGGDSYSDESAVSGNDVVIDTTRKIYYTVDIVYNTTDINTISTLIRDKATQFGGYIATSNISINEDPEYSRGTVVYKVPTDKLNSFLDFIDGEGGVVEKNVKATDITSKYDQVAARLETLRASKAAYLKILENTTNVNEIINLKSRIEDIDTEILSLEKQKDSYDNLLDFSTVTIKFNGEKEEKLLDGYGQYLLGFLKVVFYIIMYTLPFGFVAFLIVILIKGIIYLKRKKQLKK